jgi:hypothetical protein
VVQKSDRAERYSQYERSVRLPYHQAMPRSAMSRALLVYEYQRIGIENSVLVALAADMNERCAVLTFQLFKE